MTRWMSVVLTIAFGVMTACSDDDMSLDGGADSGTDAFVRMDSDLPDAAIDAAVDAPPPDAPPVDAPPFRCDGVTGVAAELASMAPGTWFEFPDSVLPESSVAYVTDKGTNRSVAGTMNAWSGGAYDSRRSRLLSHGGGHWWYAGNEIYAFALRTGEWEVAVERSELEDLVECGVIQADGHPGSDHTYNRLTYHPGWDAFVRMSGGTYCPIGGTGGPYHWLAGLGPESQVPENAWTAHHYGDNPVDPSPTHESASVYDPVRDKLYFRGHGWFEVDYEVPCTKTAANWLADGSDTCGITFTERAAESRFTARNTILVRDRYLVAIGSKSGVPDQPGGGSEVWMFDLDSDWAKSVVSTDGGSAGPDGFSNPGLAYDPINDEIVAWRGGNDVWRMDPDTLLAGAGEWERTSAGGPSVSDNLASGGVYGRMQYSPEFRGFVVAPGEEASVYFHKLSAGAECDE